MKVEIPQLPNREQRETDKLITDLLDDRDSTKTLLRNLRKEKRRIKQMLADNKHKVNEELNRLDGIEEKYVQDNSYLTNKIIASKFGVTIRYVINVGCRRYHRDRTSR